MGTDAGTQMTGAMSVQIAYHPTTADANGRSCSTSRYGGQKTPSPAASTDPQSCQSAFIARLPGPDPPGKDDPETSETLGHEPGRVRARCGCVDMVPLVGHRIRSYDPKASEFSRFRFEAPVWGVVPSQTGGKSTCLTQKILLNTEAT